MALKHVDSKQNLVIAISSICEDMFTFLFFLSDHRVCFYELGYKNKNKKQYEHACQLSIKLYLIRNLFGILKNIFKILESLPGNSLNRFNK